MDQAKMIAAVLFLMLVAYAGWTAQGWRMDAKLDAEHAQYAKLLAQERDSALTKQLTLGAEIAKIDEQREREKANADKQIKTLRSQLDSGAVSLHFNAACPAGVSTDAAATGGADAAGPRLDRSAESAYLTLVGRIHQAERMIGGLQAYAKTCQE